MRKIHRRISQQARFGGSCRSVCIAAGFMTLTSWSHAWSKSGNISIRCSSMKRRGSGVSVFELAFEHTEDILKTLVMFDICTDVHFESHMSVRLPIVDTFVLWVNSLTLYNYCKRWQIICLQLDIALLVQNSVKIWHYLSELWQGGYFFLDILVFSVASGVFYCLCSTAQKLNGSLCRG